MPAKILHAHRGPDGYHFRVHLDTEKFAVEVDEDGNETVTDEPHPDWVREWSWGNLTPGVHVHHEGRDVTEEEYHDSIEAMLKEQIALELAKLQPADHPTVDRFHGKEL
jgi:hypothetical protein